MISFQTLARGPKRWLHRSKDSSPALTSLVTYGVPSWWINMQSWMLSAHYSCGRAEEISKDGEFTSDTLGLFLFSLTLAVRRESWCFEHLA